VPKLYGVNICGAEFGTAMPGVPERDYFWPTREWFTHYVDHGVKLFRFPIRWERIQPVERKKLDASVMHMLHSTLDACASLGAQCLIELHNYGRYYDRAMTASRADVLAVRNVVDALVVSTWRHPAVFGYELFCNEPHDLVGDPETTWKLDYEAANAARRRTIKPLIWASPGWQSARHINDHSGGFVWAGDANSSIGVHTYGDGNYTGTYTVPYAQDVDASWPNKPINVNTLAERIDHAVRWCRERSLNLFVTEVGVPATSEYLAMLEAFFVKCQAEPNVLGAFLWAGGKWWPPEYPLSLEPIRGTAKPQLELLKQFQA